MHLLTKNPLVDQPTGRQRTQARTNNPVKSSNSECPMPIDIASSD